MPSSSVGMCCGFGACSVFSFNVRGAFDDWREVSLVEEGILGFEKNIGMSSSAMPEVLLCKGCNLRS